MGSGNNSNIFSGISSSISGIGSIGGAFIQSAAIKARGEFQKQTAEINTKLAEMQAKDAVRRGEKEVKQLRQGIDHIVAEQKAGFAGQGVQIDSGSALAVQESTRHVGELDVITIRNNAFRQAFGFKLDAIKQNLNGTLGMSAAEFNSSQTLLSGGADFFASAFKATQSFVAGATPERLESGKLAGTRFGGETPNKGNLFGRGNRRF